MIFFLSLWLLCSGVKVESLYLDGSIGLQTPLVSLMADKGLISHTELAIGRDQGTTAFYFEEETELPGRLTLSTTLSPLPLMPDSDHSDLPYNIYERVHEFTLQVDEPHRVISETRSYRPAMSATSLTDQQIADTLNEFEIPLTFDLDKIRQAISGLSDSGRRHLQENRFLTALGEPNWWLKLHVEVEIGLLPDGRELSVSHALFPGNSYSVRPGELEESFCATEEDSYVFMMISQHHGGLVPFSYNTLDLDGYVNLTQLHLKTGRVEGTASCIEGEREYSGKDIIITNPAPKSGRNPEVMFFSP